MKRILVCFTVAAFAGLAAGFASAATVPAGTTLVVRTLHAISSVDAPGTRFSAQLGNNVAVNGTVLLHAGTKLSGAVVTSRRIHQSSQRLTVDITQAVVNGRTLPIKTTGAFLLDNTNFKTRNDISVSRGSYTVAAGRTMQFHLAQPLKL